MRPSTYVLLNLQALSDNLDKVREYAPNTQVLAVIKANGYGHGLLRVAKSLADANAFAVARADEAMCLRSGGISKRIVVLEGFSCNEELIWMLENRVDVVIHSYNQVQQLEKYSGSKTTAVWLKLDTGMNRLGFSTADFVAVYRRLKDSPCVEEPMQLMTHLANADIRSDQKTAIQVVLFKEAIGAYSGEQSIANSAGVLAWPQAHKDWVRPGIMLYGVSPFAETDGRVFGLRPVMSLVSRLLTVKQINVGDTVGYGGHWCCKKSTLLGVIAAGYGDGYPREVMAGTPVLINNIKVPIIGRVSMDMITVDLQDCQNVKPGDSVTLWGKGLPVEELAGYANTIPYTLLCGITQRVGVIEVASTDSPTTKLSSASL